MSAPLTAHESDARFHANVKAIGDTIDRLRDTLARVRVILKRGDVEGALSVIAAELAE